MPLAAEKTVESAAAFLTVGFDSHWLLAQQVPRWRLRKILPGKQWFRFTSRVSINWHHRARRGLPKTALAKQWVIGKLLWGTWWRMWVVSRDVTFQRASGDLELQLISFSWTKRWLCWVDSMALFLTEVLSLHQPHLPQEPFPNL